MDELKKKISELEASLKTIFGNIKFDELSARSSELTTQANQPDLWNDPKKATAVMKEQASLNERIATWREIADELNDISTFAKTNDTSLKSELEDQIANLQAKLDKAKKALRFNKPYDDSDAILSIYAGAGGTDAQDWAEMLMRMYSRWTEKKSFKAKVLNESAGEEAGIKSVTLEISGPQAYGHLRGEHGVHRLVRQSPFNADALRQTSFAKVEVLPKIERPEDVLIDDKDLKIDVYRSGGHGGQSVNTTDSAVRITHVPTGITVAIQNERSQLQNRETAMTILRSKLIQMQMEQHLEKLSDLKGENQSAEWGSQIRSYVLHPYKMVKDLRTGYETSDPDNVLDGDIDNFIDAYTDSTVEA